MRKFTRRAEPVFAKSAVTLARGRDMDEFEPQARRGRSKDLIALGAAIVAVGAILTNALFLQSGPHPSPIFSNKPASAKPVKPAKTVAAVPQATAHQSAPGNVTLPRARPQDFEPARAEAPGAARKPADIISDIQRELARRGFYEGATDGIYGPKTDAAIRDFEQAAGLKGGAEPSDNLLRAITRSNVKAAATTNATAPRPPDPIAELIAPSTNAPSVSAPSTTTASTGASSASTNSGNKRVVAVQRALSDYGYGQIRPTGILDRETQSAIEHFERGKRMPVTGQISPRLLNELSALSGRPLE